MSKLPNCHDCGVAPGELHRHWCDVERCPRCGCQRIGCGCIYAVCGIERSTLEETHPDIYNNGPTQEMYHKWVAKWDAEWASKRIPWSGIRPGVVECYEFGWYSRWDNTPSANGHDKGWVRCNKDDLGADADLNRLYGSGEAEWSVEQQRFVLRKV